MAVLGELKSRWKNWDGKGNSLPELANQYKYTFLCDDSFEKIRPLVSSARSICTDSTGVYTSKMISQIFPDIAIPFDTASKSIMKQCGYNPNDYGNGMLKEEVLNFIKQNRLSASKFRSFDDAPLSIWENYPPLNGEVTTFSRVIDKLFYSQK